ncbi:MAG TPA: stability/partitioning determinant [Candidatus Bathyarchaeia archaeon]|nr:stability/partitioning determinant [Candidatus Bathyarchaeia archaeon]
MSERASIFADPTDFDVSSFVPRKEKRGGGVSSDVVRAVSEASQFPSREPAPAAAPTKIQEPRREPRRYRTGRNVQLNIKVRAETLESFYAMADSQGWVLGQTLERAIEALRRELTPAADQARLPDR